MIEQLRRNRGLALVTGIALLALFWWPDFSGYFKGEAPTVWLPLTGFTYDHVDFRTPLYLSLALLFMIINALSLHLLNLRFELLGRSNWLLPLFYLLLISAFPSSRAFSPAIPAALLVIVGLYFLFQSGQQQGALAAVFIAPLCISCAGCLYFPAFAFIISFIAGLFILRMFSFRELFIFLCGFLLPVGMLILWRFLAFGDTQAFLELLYDMGVSIHIQLIPRTLTALLLIMLLLYLLVRAVVQPMKSSSGTKMFRARAFSVFVWMLVLGILPMMLFADKISGYLPVIMIPVSICLSHYYSAPRITWRMKVELIILFLAMLLNHVAGFM